MGSHRPRQLPSTTACSTSTTPLILDASHRSRCPRNAWCTLGYVAKVGLDAAQGTSSMPDSESVPHRNYLAKNISYHLKYHFSRLTVALFQSTDFGRLFDLICLRRAVALDSFIQGRLGDPSRFGKSDAECSRSVTYLTASILNFQILLRTPYAPEII